MAKVAGHSKPLPTIVRASARRIWTEHGIRSHAFAAERLKASVDLPEIETWRAIIAALRAISLSERTR